MHLVLVPSGKFNDAKDAKMHIYVGARNKGVITSAPAKQPYATILIGINDNVYESSSTISS